MPSCKVCGCAMIGDGYNTPYICESLDIDYINEIFSPEPDADPIYCSDFYLMNDLLLTADENMSFKEAFESYKWKSEKEKHLLYAELLNINYVSPNGEFIKATVKQLRQRFCYNV